MADNNQANQFEVAIIGGGPAALTAALYARRKELSTALIAKEIGGQLLWTNEIENYPGFSSITGYELLKKFREHAREYEPQEFIDETVLNVEKEGGLFQVETDSGRGLQAHTLVVATGKRPRKLNVPGEEEYRGKGVSYCTTCDAPLYRDRKVAIIGGGDAAFEGIIDVLPIADKVYNINRSQPRAEPILQKRVNGEEIQSYHDHQVLEIYGNDLVEGVKIEKQSDGSVQNIEVDGVFVEIGLIPNTEFISHLVQTNERGEIVVDCDTRTSVKGIFGAGDVTTVPEKQVVISAGEGAKAALAAYRYLIRQ
ncbi:MAG: NAD(P)/FAD-dependent oxidoreductase [Candidatus Bipolaricaulota bacterium]